jgi:hypothetical protein
MPRDLFFFTIIFFLLMTAGAVGYLGGLNEGKACYDRITVRPNG